MFDQLPVGDIQVCLGSDGTSDYLLVNITSQVQVLFDYAVHNLFSNFANKAYYSLVMYMYFRGVLRTTKFMHTKIFRQQTIMTNNNCITRHAPN